MLQLMTFLPAEQATVPLPLTVEFLISYPAGVTLPQ
jgi:hypothetical protein